MTTPRTNPVGFLQEFCQKYKAASLPNYIELGASGPDHCREFSVQCIYDEYKVTGKSRQKKHAKYEAAKGMVDLLLEKKYFEKFNIYLSQTGLEVIEDHLESDPSINLGITKNPISALQEYCQGKKIPLPVYFEVKVGTCSSNFLYECSVDNKKTYGQGSNKKIAKTEAAINMCKKLNIANPSSSMYNQEQEVVDYTGGKNAVSALQEFCARNKSLSTPVYEDKGARDNLFVVTCHVGAVSVEATEMTKQGAKFSAANGVLIKLVKMAETINGNGETQYTPSCNKLCNGDSILPEYKLSDDEDTEDIAGASYHITNRLESLNLEDSLVEVEPSTGVMKTESNGLELADDKSQIKTSHSRNEAPYRTGLSEITEESKVGLGDIIILPSGQHFTRLFKNCIGQKITLTGVLGRHSESASFTSFKLKILKIEAL